MLPKLDVPTYELVLPLSKKKIKFRPFLVKEQKNLLMAMEANDSETIHNAIRDVLNNCTMTPDFRIDETPIIDIEYYFLQLRAKSVGEFVELILKCDTCEDEKASVKYDIDLTKINVNIPKEHNKTISLFNDVGVIMKYPSLEMLKKLEGLTGSDAEAIFEIIQSCIDSVYDSQQMYSTKDHKPEEIRQFIDNLTQEQFMKLQQFFETMPKLEEKVNYKCPMCGKDHEKFVRGLEAFF